MCVASDVTADNDTRGGGVPNQAARRPSVSGYSCSYSVAEPRQIVLYTNI